MTTNRQDELSLHMRIPADKCYLNNAILTLDGICEHFSLTETSRDKMKKALDMALSKSIDFSYEKKDGLFDLQFSIYKDKLMIVVEDYFLDTDDSVSANNEKIRNLLQPIEMLTDGFLFTDKNGRNACFSMAFNLSFIEENE